MGDAGSWWAIAEQAAMLHGAGPWGCRVSCAPSKTHSYYIGCIPPGLPPKLFSAFPHSVYCLSTLAWA